MASKTRKGKGPPKLAPGRPALPMGAGTDAPQLNVRLDLDAEAAVTALRVCWQTPEDGIPAAAATLKRAAVLTAERECPEDFARAVADVRERRGRG